jgi:hypothetical protein
MMSVAYENLLVLPVSLALILFPVEYSQVNAFQNRVENVKLQAEIGQVNGVDYVDGLSAANKLVAELDQGQATYTSSVVSIEGDRHLRVRIQGEFRLLTFLDAVFPTHEILIRLERND